MQRKIDTLRQKRADPKRNRISQAPADNHLSRRVIRGRKPDDRPFRAPRQLYPRPYPFDLCHSQPECIGQKGIYQVLKDRHAVGENKKFDKLPDELAALGVPFGKSAPPRLELCNKSVFRRFGDGGAVSGSVCIPAPAVSVIADSFFSSSFMRLPPFSSFPSSGICPAP